MYVEDEMEDVEEEIEVRVGDKSGVVGCREVSLREPSRNADAFHHHRKLAEDENKSDGRN